MKLTGCYKPNMSRWIVELLYGESHDKQVVKLGVIQPVQLFKNI